MQPSHFVFATCHPGLEDALIHELASRRPELRRSYTRPGFLTLKQPDTPVDAAAPLGARLARAFGVGLSPWRDAADGVAWVRALAAAAGPLFLHHWALEGASLQWERLAALQAVTPGCWTATLRAHAPVFDVVSVQGGASTDANTMVWLGWHRHTAGHSEHPGGCMPLVVPPEAPSRSYGKTVEALAWSGAGLAAGDTVLELGSAPGGSTLALLQRGLHVLAVDPGGMAPSLATVAQAHDVRFVHLCKPVGQLLPREVPPVQWLLSDMNLAPAVVLRALQRLLPAQRASLRGVLMNWKINDLAVVSGLETLLQRFAALGFCDVRAAHLGQHRREIAVWGRQESA